MAQDISSRVWFFDAVTAPGDDLHKNGFDKQESKIGNIVWTEMAASGHELIIVDAAGKIIVKATVDDPNEDFRTGKIGWIHGLNISKLDSGVVMVYLDGK